MVLAIVTLYGGIVVFSSPYLTTPISNPKAKHKRRSHRLVGFVVFAVPAKGIHGFRVVSHSVLPPVS